jgi:hypothetical protein
MTRFFDICMMLHHNQLQFTEVVSTGSAKLDKGQRVNGFLPVKQLGLRLIDIKKPLVHPRLAPCHGLRPPKLSPVSICV